MSASTVVFDPGWVIKPTTMPISTAMNAVIANHSSVCTARRAAFATLRRFAMELTIAVKISGMTATVSNAT